MHNNEGTRINKYLSEHGICSRREADRFLEEGRIFINGKKAEMGQKIQEKDVVSLDGKEIGRAVDDPPVLLAFHKPRGIVCTTGSRDRAENIVDYIHYPYRIFPIGRLDKDSEGLILLTNRGALVNDINRARNVHEKEYQVRCADRISETFIRKMADGPVIRIPSGETDPVSGKEIYKKVKTNACTVWRVDDYTFRIILTQGLNRQIRRMCESLGNKVTRLKRIRIMNITLDGLEEGKYREVSGKELKTLEESLKRR